MALGLPTSAKAQGFRVSGRVVRVSAGDSTPVASHWAVLHGVTLSGGSPLDSQLTDRRGFYRIAAPERDTLANYLVSVTYQGIAYFTDPVPGRGSARNELPPLLVYDTSSSGPPIELAQRNVVVRSPDEDGSRRIVELWVLANRGTRTRITSDTSQPVWEGAIPRGAVQFEVGEADVNPETVTRRGDRVAVLSPITPGERQVLLGYELPRSERELAIPLDQPIGRLTVLLEDTAATVTGGRLSFAGVETLGDLFLRQYSAEAVAAGTDVRVRFQGHRRDFADLWWLFLGMFFLLMAGALVLWLKRPESRAVAPVESPEVLAALIAQLDRDHEGRETDEYHERRAALKRRLAEALARRTGDR